MPHLNFLAVTNYSTIEQILDSPALKENQEVDFQKLDRSSTVSLPQKKRAKRRNAPSKSGIIKSIKAQQEPDVLLPIIQAWRKKDNRIWSDEEVQEFPETFFYNLHQAEWQQKAELAKNLITYLKAEGKSDFSVLEVGCDCGWLSQMIADTTAGKVTGIDIDSSRITQANKLFSNTNLGFKSGNFFTMSLPSQSFDFIVLMDAHKWMPSLEEVKERAKSLLTPGGELHILTSDLLATRGLKRTQDKYAEYCTDKMMSSILPHISWITREDFINAGFEDLKHFSLRKKLLGKKQSGGWMRIKAGRK